MEQNDEGKHRHETFKISSKRCLVIFSGISMAMPIRKVDPRVVTATHMEIVRKNKKKLFYRRTPLTSRRVMMSDAKKEMLLKMRKCLYKTPR